MFKVKVTWKRRTRFPPLFTFTIEEHEERDRAVNALNVYVSAWSRELKKKRPVEVFVEDERGERILGYNLQEMPEAEEDPAAVIRKKYPQGVEALTPADVPERGEGKE